MNLRPRSLFVKIFLWFCLTVAASSLLVLVLAGLTGSQPFGRRWMAMTQDLYAHSALDFYSTSGASALARYLATLRTNSGIEGHLLTPDGSDVLGAPYPQHADHVFREALRTGVSQLHLGRYWTAATCLRSPPASSAISYVFVMEAHPHEGFLDGKFLRAAAPRFLGAALLFALFCFLLARHITQPIQVLQNASSRMASGDLTVRTMPALGRRTDELATMASAFDTMAARIENLLQTQHQMLADISHELRSPLTRISVSLELLRRGEYDVLEPMQADLDRLNQMIGQILDLMRFEIPDATTPLAAVDLVPILAEIVESAALEGRGANKSVILSAASRPYNVLADESHLRTCIENIVRNALQHSPEDGRISIVIESVNANRVGIRVEDNGPGVPEDALPRIFEPFFRVPGIGKSHPLGSGLGLSLSARIVARYHGTITASNLTPHGLSVSLTFPSASAHPGQM